MEESRNKDEYLKEETQKEQKEQKEEKDEKV